MDILTEARCTRGAEIVRSLGLRVTVADAGYYLDEHWDGKGAPWMAVGEEISLLSHILCAEPYSLPRTGE
jgi:response regulator RpfG family c-di-GMP phosphodiesterase